MKIIETEISIKKKLAFVILLPLLTSCATYNSGFACGDARGVACTPMEKVDQLISSGEIEAYISNKKKCRGRPCSGELQQDVLQSALVGDKK